MVYFVTSPNWSCRSRKYGEHYQDQGKKIFQGEVVNHKKTHPRQLSGRAGMISNGRRGEGVDKEFWKDWGILCDGTVRKNNKTKYICCVWCKETKSHLLLKLEPKGRKQIKMEEQYTAWVGHRAKRVRNRSHSRWEKSTMLLATDWPAPSDVTVLFPPWFWCDNSLP